MQITDFRNKVCDEIKKQLPMLKACKGHGGRFDLGELKRISGRTPAVYVAITGTGRGQAVGTGETDLPLQMAAFIITSDRKGLSRTDASLNIAEYLIGVISGNSFDFQGAHPAGPVTGKNLYNGSLDRVGIALWGITWSQTLRLGKDVFETNYPLLKKLYLGLSPEIGTGHESDYIVVEGK